MLDQVPLHLDREGIKEREDGERGGGRLFQEGDYFKYFHQRGAIIRGRRLIEEIRYKNNAIDVSSQQHLWYFVSISYDCKAGRRQEMLAVFSSIIFLVICLKLLVIPLQLLSGTIYL